jgi:ElaB/YqjD/DUF883 family membrane-anchored ribosome-binding protein
MQDRKSYLEARAEELEACAGALDKLRQERGQDAQGAGASQLAETLRTIEEKMRHASEGLNNLKEATAENWESLKTLADHSFQELKEALKHISEEASHSPAIQSMTGYMKSTEKCIQKNPLGAAFAALGVGFILGRMLKS